jgi:pimeloyl-ACP methyl ester carboxylesterase
MSKIRVEFVHGINTGDPYAVGKDVEKVMRAAGLDVDVTTMGWGSTGTITGDVAKLTLAKGMLDALGLVSAQVHRAIAYARDTPTVLVAHSMGTALTHVALALAGGDVERVGVVYIGSPLTNPALRLQLAACGLLPAPAVRHEPIPTFYNDEDPITGGGAYLEPWMAPTRVAIAGRAQAFEEHAAHLYAGHPLVVDKLKELTAR